MRAGSFQDRFNLVAVFASGLLITGLVAGSPATAREGASQVDGIPDEARIEHATQEKAHLAGIFVVNTATDTSDSTPGDGVCADAAGRCSLRAAVQEANAGGDARGIRLQANHAYALTQGGSGEDAAATGDLDIAGTIEIFGNGASLDVAGLDRAFDVAAGANLTVRNLNVRNGQVSDESGGAYRSAGYLALLSGSVADSAAAGAGASGGAVFNDGGQLVINGVRISGCSATRAGGAVEANGGRTDIRFSQLVSNDTGPLPGNGGAFHLTGMGRVDIRGTLVEDNTAAREGGGLWNSGSGRMTVSDSVVVRNAALGVAADDGGGGLFNDGGYLEVSDTRVSGNTATAGSGSGGGLFNNQGVLRIRSAQITNNASNRAGGGIEAVAGSTDIWNSNLQKNDTGPTPGNGGALHLTGAGFVSVNLSDVKGNTATAEGGGLWVSAVGTMIVTQCTVENNRASGNDADQGGGGLFNDGGFLLVEQSRVALNVADGTSGSGGGVLNNGGDLEIVGSTLAQNVSQRAGGGVEAKVGYTRLDGVTLQDNRTGASPGNGGGLHLTGAGQVFVENGQIKRNAAAAEGGGLWNSATGTMIVKMSNIRANNAPVGPDVFNDGGSFLIDGVAVAVGP